MLYININNLLLLTALGNFILLLKITDDLKQVSGVQYLT